MPELPPLRDVIRAYGLDARKSLGQHFILDLNLTRKIAAAAGDVEGKTILEIGPGPGGLTRALLETDAAQVIAIEQDSRAVNALNSLQNLYPKRLKIVHGDALTVDINQWPGKPFVVVANLPYNISTALLMQWLDHPGLFSHFTLMFQKEVADRLVARPGNKQYGRLSVMAQCDWHVQRRFDVPPNAFTPAPKVTSSIVQLHPRSDNWMDPPIRRHMAWIVKSAFGQRRKMLRQSLRPLGNNLLPLLEQLAIDPKARAEDLSVDQYKNLAMTHYSS